MALLLAFTAICTWMLATMVIAIVTDAFMNAKMEVQNQLDRSEYEKTQMRESLQGWVYEPVVKTDLSKSERPNVSERSNRPPSPAAADSRDSPQTPSFLGWTNLIGMAKANNLYGRTGFSSELTCGTAINSIFSSNKKNSQKGEGVEEVELGEGSTPPQSSLDSQCQSGASPDATANGGDAPVVLAGQQGSEMAEESSGLVSDQDERSKALPEPPAERAGALAVAVAGDLQEASSPSDRIINASQPKMPGLRKRPSMLPSALLKAPKQTAVGFESPNNTIQSYLIKGCLWRGDDFCAPDEAGINPFVKVG